MLITGPFTSEFREFCGQNVPDVIRRYPVVSAFGQPETIVMRRVMRCVEDEMHAGQKIIAFTAIRLSYSANCLGQMNRDPGVAENHVLTVHIENPFDPDLTDAEIVSEIESLVEEICLLPDNADLSLHYG